jgi:hypothetical protein
MRNILNKLNWILSNQFGLDPSRFLRSLCGMPRFIRNWRKFRKSYSGRLVLVPCLHDWYEEGGAIRNEYFWQDLLVASWIFEANPQRHVDVGSRIDGFVAHLASFREIEVFDVRPIDAKIPRVISKQADLMGPLRGMKGYCDSLSCLHALEHFGLGRYGDPIDPRGYERGMANMAELLKIGGKFYLSAPIGRERVEFNSNYVFDPRTIIHCAKANDLNLDDLTVISGEGTVRHMQTDEKTMLELARCSYNLGVFVFSKVDHTRVLPKM